MQGKVVEPLSIELSNGAKGYSLPKTDLPETSKRISIPEHLLRKDVPKLPSLSENEAVRHFVRLSRLNYAIDINMYPLGSCTMKYNPKINEDVAQLEGFLNIHPHTPEQFVQGALQLMYELQKHLISITGMDAVSLQPVAGAQGELAGILIISAYHRKKGRKNRRKVIIPDSAHGTNPATVTLAGLEAVEISTTDTNGIIKASKVKEIVDRYGEDSIAGIMLTNPNTLGIFEREIEEIAEILHEIDAQVYMDGANMNALVGHVKPADLGVDVMHLNLHKTFSTPHGGGGPGSGVICVREHLEPFLPIPRIEYDGEQYKLSYDHPDSIGRLHAFYGNFLVFVRALTYILMMGDEGLKFISEIAVLNANYLRKRLVEVGYELRFDEPTMHEFVLTLKELRKNYGVKAQDVAKRLLDYGLHAPTVYFPIIVEEAFMIEPTESESKRTLDAFAKAMEDILEECRTDKRKVLEAPQNTPISRPDEVKAARELVLSWKDTEEYSRIS